MVDVDLSAAVDLLPGVGVEDHHVLHAAIRAKRGTQRVAGEDLIAGVTAVAVGVGPTGAELAPVVAIRHGRRRAGQVQNGRHVDCAHADRHAERDEGDRDHGQRHPQRRSVAQPHAATAGLCSHHAPYSAELPHSSGWARRCSMDPAVTSGG